MSGPQFSDEQGAFITLNVLLSSSNLQQTINLYVVFVDTTHLAEIPSDSSRRSKVGNEWDSGSQNTRFVTLASTVTMLLKR